MVPYYVQLAVLLCVDIALLCWVVTRLVSTAPGSRAVEPAKQTALILFAAAVGLLALSHLGAVGFYLAMAVFGNRSAIWMSQAFPLVSCAFYVGFGIFAAAAIGQFVNNTDVERTVSDGTRENGTQPETMRPVLVRRHTDWGYLWKQVRLAFFRGIGILLLLIAAPLAFAQQNAGVGIMAVATAIGCLWLGFHRNSPLAIKYATAAEED